MIMPGMMLADLAGAVNELVEVRHHVEIYETEVINGSRRRRTRRRHIITLPSLLDALHQAAQPEVTGDAAAAGSFESAPPGADNPVHVLRIITDGSAVWARALGVIRETLPGRLRGLVGAAMTEDQLANLLRDAQRWVRLAQDASRENAPDYTLNLPCPYCWRRNALTVSGDHDRAKCTACGYDWDESTIGLLGQMLEANKTHETMTSIERCWWDDCYRRGAHDEHWGRDGRAWRDVCEIWPRRAELRMIES